MKISAIILLFLPAVTAFVATSTPRRIIPATVLQSSPFDEFLGSIFGKDEDNDESSSRNKGSDTNDEEIDISSFQQELAKRQEQQIADDLDNTVASKEEEEEFDGYMMRDAIYNKFGECFDVDFNKVDSYGFRSVYLNIMPFRLGGKRFRHKTELDYLCHLQAVVEILQKYNQLDYVLAQLEETNKKPRAGTSPLIAVPLRLDLTEEQVNQIMG
ncbi:hypothetical protein ACHAWT_003310 [Skeletonema menzelii]